MNLASLKTIAFAFMGLYLVSGCGSIPLPQGSQSQPEAIALLQQSQKAHGKAAFEAIKYISVSYTGT